MRDISCKENLSSSDLSCKLVTLLAAFSLLGKSMKNQKPKHKEKNSNSGWIKNYYTTSEAIMYF